MKLYCIAGNFYKYAGFGELNPVHRMEFYQKTSENQKVAPCDPQKPETWNLILKTANLKPETSNLKREL